MSGERSSRGQVSVEQILALRARVAGDIVEVDPQTWAIHGFIPVDGEVILAEFDHPQTARSLLDQLVEDEPGISPGKALPVPGTVASTAGRRSSAGVRAVARMSPGGDGTDDSDRRFADRPHGFLTATEDRVLAFLDSIAAVDAAIKDLVALGVLQEEIVVLRGPQRAERVDVSGDWNGLWGRIYRLLEWMGDERDVLRRVGEHLARGGLVVTVPVEDGSEAAVALALASQGGHEMVHFGRRRWERLGPD